MKKLNNKVLPVLCLSALLAACSSGGSSSSPAPENRGQQNQSVPEQKQPEQKQPEQKQPEQKQPEPKQPEPKQPEPKQPEPKQPEPKQPEPKQPQPKQPEPNQPEPKQPEPKQPEPKQPEPKQPEPNQPQPQPPVASYDGDGYLLNFRDSSDWSKEYQGKTKTIKVNSLSTRGENLSSTEKIITLKSDIKDNEDDYEFILLGEDAGYYGYYKNLETSDNINVPDSPHWLVFANLVYSYNKNLKENDPIPANFSATYKKDNGFLYSAIDLAESQDSAVNSIVKKGNVELEFKNGTVTSGQVTSPLGTIFNIAPNAGNNSSIILTPTSNANSGLTVKIEGDRAVMNLNFINSAPNTRDRKYIVGGTKTDKWIGVLAAEKQ